MISPELLEWVSREVGERVSVVRVFAGATTATVVELQAGRQRLVLKAFSVDSFVLENPDRAAHEAQVLESLTDAGMPVPRPISVDETGTDAGVPAVLMSLCVGSQGGVPPSEGAAGLACRLHGLDIDLPWTFARYTPVEVRAGPRWAADSGLWRAAFEAVVDVQYDPVPIHRDFHLGNLLWQGSTVTGIVDWVYACMGPAGIDVARFRLDLALNGNPAAGKAFFRAYSRSNPAYRHDARWDLADAIDVLPWYEGEGAACSWGDRAQRTALEAFLGQALVELDRSN